MNGPRRLRETGGISERLLESASLDKPSRASRARALELAATAGAFVATTGGAAAAAAAVKGGGATALYKSVAMWICIGALGGGTAALVASELTSSGRNNPPAPSSASTPVTPPLVVPEPVVASPTPQGEVAAPAAPPTAGSGPTPSHSTPHSPTLREAPAAPEQPSASPSLPIPTAVPGTGIANFADPEAQQIEAARAAVARGDSGSALKTLDNYDASHPNGSLKAESAALRVQAVSNTGNSAKAQTLANEFEKKYPQSPLRGAVRDAAKLK